MDLGIAGKRALVCAASKGLGLGCARALAEAGVDLVMNARGSEALEASADVIRSDFGVSVETVACDVTTQDGQSALLDAGTGVDILVTNAGGPPPGMWSDWQRDDFIAAFDMNCITPIALMTALMPGMIDKRWGRVVNITSMTVKAPAVPALGLSNTARTGLTGYVAGVSRQVAPFGVIVNNLLPGFHATDRMDAIDTNTGQTQGTDMATARAARQSTVPARKYGTIEEFGATCAFMCSQYAAYMVGQNILLDGGVIESTF